MKLFIKNVFWFVIPLSLLLLMGIILPTTPKASGSLLMAAKKKDSLLQYAPSPRIIFVGGSNLSFGLNSQSVKDSLNINPINTAIHASIGVKFMMDNTLKHVKNGDVVVLVPEYNQYYRDVNSGSEELMRMVFDINYNNIKSLNRIQKFKLVPYIPKYALTKYNIIEYLNVFESVIYSVNSFNKYGDTDAHWGMQKQVFAPFGQISRPFNYESIKLIKEFCNNLEQKGATLFISYPGLQSKSFKNSKIEIGKVEEELKKAGLPIIGTANRYKMADSLMFNSPYHLNKRGVDYRTNLLIEDLQKVLP